MPARDWNLDDFRDQLRAVRRMAPLSSLLGAIPGMSSAAGTVTGAELEALEGMLAAMTAEERATPTLLSEGEEAPARRSRVARDSGARSEDVLALVRQFHAMQRMLRRSGGPGGAVPS